MYVPPGTGVKSVPSLNEMVACANDAPTSTTSAINIVIRSPRENAWIRRRTLENKVSDSSNTKECSSDNSAPVNHFFHSSSCLVWCCTLPTKHSRESRRPLLNKNKSDEYY